MKRLLIILCFAGVPSITIAQGANDVSITDLIKETQQWSKTEKRMTFTWWIPDEYWVAALKDNNQVPKEAIDQLLSIFGNYVLIMACDFRTGPNGTMLFTSEEDVRKSISLTDNTKGTHFPLTEDQLDPQVLLVVEKMKPLFSQTLGQMGRGIHVYFFEVKDDNHLNMISASKPGGFSVSHSDTEFTWKLPLPTLLPPKFCSVDNEKMQGNWNYCPVHGQKLGN